MDNVKKLNRYEVIYLPFDSKGKVDPTITATQSKNFAAADDFTALVYSLSLVSADRENYFKNGKIIKKKEALDYVYDFLYPESFKTGLKKSQITYNRILNLIDDTQQDEEYEMYNDKKGRWQKGPYTDFGYIFSVVNLTDNNTLYKAPLDPVDWNYNFPSWWHQGEYADKYGAYEGNPEALESHLPKRRF